jgi:hypothetical protein
MLSLKRFEPIAQSANGHLKEAAQNTNLILGVSVAALILAAVAVVISIVRT